jgi:mRNA-degrading endonuclease RelE of RelBE toxin-antitoxin system
MTALAEKTGLSREMLYRTLSEIRRAEKLLSEDEHDGLIAFLASDPEAGDEIVGTGGVRKVRYGAKGKGKSGGVRVIYFYDQDMPIYALLVYGKNERADLTAEQRKAVAAFAAAIKATRKRK